MKMEKTLILCALLVVTLALFLKENFAEDAQEIEKRGTPEKEALELHNELRKIHDAPAMRLDNEMNNRATAYARKLARIRQMKHATSEERKGNGENLAYGCKYGASEGLSAKKAVEMWYREVCDFDFNSGGFSAATGHFTQLVWKGSTKLGFGMASFKKRGEMICTYIVARYSPAGNFRGQFRENVKRGSYNGCICKRGADINCNSGGSGGGGGGGEKCEDKNQKCEVWERYCTIKRYKNYMKKHCSKTCKFCGSGGSGGGGGQRVDGKFSNWSSFGDCSKTCGSGIQSRTRACSNPPPRNGGRNCVGNTIQSRNCNTRPCPAECEDKKERCSDWKNFCQSRNTRQKNYMKKYCSKTCKFCGRGGSGGGGGQRECEDKRAGCDRLTRYCDSDRYSNYMKKHCSKTCNLCECEDKREGCDRLTRYCDSDRYSNYMKKHCSKTCNFCG